MSNNTKKRTQNKVSESCITFELETPLDSEEPIYLAGNFNAWNANDEKYRLNKVGRGKYYFVLDNYPSGMDILEYKYVMGNWHQEELNFSGHVISNRKVRWSEKMVKDYVPMWRKHKAMFNEFYLPEKITIAEDFEIPQLIKTRRITALVPHDYRHNDKHYPVIYLQDGQNLFDDFAPFGNWGIDKKLAMLAERGQGDIIIVAIDHAEEERIEEFTPSHKTKLGKGEGKKYVRFMADTLKPYVDKHFRTLPDRQNTGIGGSSMGALISIYAGIMYPEVYSRLMLFSPSLWVDPNIYFNLTQFLGPLDLKIYMYGGGKEGSNMINNLNWLKETLNNQGRKEWVDFKLKIDPNGHHNEVKWGEEFPEALEWLFFNT